MNLIVEVTDLDVPFPVVSPDDFTARRAPITMRVKLGVPNGTDPLTDQAAIDPDSIAMQIGNAIIEAIKQKQEENKVAIKTPKGDTVRLERAKVEGELPKDDGAAGA